MRYAQVFRKPFQRPAMSATNVGGLAAATGILIYNVSMQLIGNPVFGSEEGAYCGRRFQYGLKVEVGEMRGEGSEKVQVRGF